MTTMPSAHGVSALASCLHRDSPVDRVIAKGASWLCEHYPTTHSLLSAHSVPTHSGLSSPCLPPQQQRSLKLWLPRMQSTDSRCMLCEQYRTQGPLTRGHGASTLVSCLHCHHLHNSGGARSCSCQGCGPSESSRPARFLCALTSTCSSSSGPLIS